MKQQKYGSMSQVIHFFCVYLFSFYENNCNNKHTLLYNLLKHPNRIILCKYIWNKCYTRIFLCFIRHPRLYLYVSINKYRKKSVNINIFSCNWHLTIILKHIIYSNVRVYMCRERKNFKFQSLPILSHRLSTTHTPKCVININFYLLTRHVDIFYKTCVNINGI